MTNKYWIIRYCISFRSDFHVGEGITLIGGNLHGLRLDDDGFPYMPSTQVRGLLRLGGLKLKKWQGHFDNIFLNNFPGADKKAGNSWSYTPARFSSIEAGQWNADEAGLLTQQSHIRQKKGIAKNLFSYQKAGKTENYPCWCGNIFSIEPASEKDVAFLIACMRAEDRIGHRRSRGYGKVDWKPETILAYEAGKPPQPVKRSLEEWIKVIFEQ